MRTLFTSDFRPLDSDVEQLFECAAQESFFNLPEWYALIASCGLDAEAHVGLSVSDDARLGLIWCERSRKGTGVLSSCTNLYSCEFDILKGDAGADAVRLFAKEFAQTETRRDLIHLQGLDPAKPQFGALVSGFRAAGWVVKPHFGWGSWYEKTRGTDFDRYRATRPAILRNTWKRKNATARKSPGFAIGLYESGDEIAPYIDAYERIQAQSWKQPEPFGAFIPKLIRLAAELGALRFGILKIGGIPAAAQFWIVWNGKATIFKLVHAEEFNKFSPGTLLTMRMTHEVLEKDRPDEINFGRGDDAYKKLWMSSRREHWGIEAANPRTARGLFLAARLSAALGRDYLKGMVAWAERARNLRQHNLRLAVPAARENCFEQTNLSG